MSGSIRFKKLILNGDLQTAMDVAKKQVKCTPANAHAHPNPIYKAAERINASKRTGNFLSLVDFLVFLACCVTRRSFAYNSMYCSYVSMCVLTVCTVRCQGLHRRTSAVLCVVCCHFSASHRLLVMPFFAPCWTLLDGLALLFFSFFLALRPARQGRREGRRGVVSVCFAEC